MYKEDKIPDTWQIIPMSVIPTSSEMYGRYE